MAFLGMSRGAAGMTVFVARDASPLEALASREVARYFYLRTGRMPEVASGRTPPAGECVVVARKGRAILRRLLREEGLREAVAGLGPQQFIVKSVTGRRTAKAVVVVGGDDVGTLYGAYRLIERLGVRFYLHGDVVPDARIAPALPDVDERGAPLFKTRGINPFHDFPEGPDWWDEDDYLAYIAQLAKMRMNLIGLHCYPEGGVGPEPGVWIGLPSDVGPGGRVKFAYPSQWANTARNGMWGYTAMKTSEFAAGASEIFAVDDYGPEVMEGLMPRPKSPEDSARLFDRTGEMFGRVFSRARTLGVKTCIGTETPLTVPKAVREHLKKKGKDFRDAAVVRDLYRGMFGRIAKLYPVDYYWLWTPEGWTWGGNKPKQFEATVADVGAALGALEDLGKPFTLATCGWVLGPQHDRAALDAILPKTSPMSCINRKVGHSPVEPGFANVTGRPLWAIPWMENDPNMVGPQPWVGRMRHDAADALRLGCTGLLGIHWRTKVLAMNVSALALAAWDQSWAPGADVVPEAAKPARATRPPEGPVGGKTAKFSAPVEGTDDDPVYQVVRYDVSAYRLDVPNGTYTVTIKLNEPHYEEAGKRVFGAKAQGRVVFKSVDIFARVGKNRALDIPLEGVRVTDGRLKIEFPRKTELPCVAAIAVEGTRDAANQIAAGPYSRKINCGGPAWRGYEKDPAGSPGASGGAGGRNRSMPTEDFYLDFARASFGDAAAKPVGSLLARVDGVNFPEHSKWQGGPGAVKVHNSSREDVDRLYAFVDEFAELRPHVTSPGDVARFDYWLETFRYARAMAQVGACRGRLDGAMKALGGEKDAAKRRKLARGALGIRIELAREWERMMTHQLAAADTPGELGTIANLEQHTRRRLKLLSAHDANLAKALGVPLPASVALAGDYGGPARIAVPTVRSLAAPGEEIRLKVILLAPGKASAQGGLSGSLLWRPMGAGGFARLPLVKVGRAVHRAKLPAVPEGAIGIEYYVEARLGGETLIWPATAPGLCRTVVLLAPEGE